MSENLRRVSDPGCAAIEEARVALCAFSVVIVTRAHCERTTRLPGFRGANGTGRRALARWTRSRELDRPRRLPSTDSRSDPRTGRHAGPSGAGAGSGVYGLGVAARNAAYDRGWKRTHRAAVPVISVGNITLGGTGKTPMVEWIARWYRRRGVRVALISRGYGHAGGINDEGLVLEENLPDVPHLQDPDRVALAEIAVASWKPS